MEIYFALRIAVLLIILTAAVSFRIGFKMGTENGYWRGRLDELLNKGGPNG